MAEQQDMTAAEVPVPGVARLLVYGAFVASVMTTVIVFMKYPLMPTVLAFCMTLQVSAVIGVPIVVLLVRRFGGLEDKPTNPRQMPKMEWFPRRVTWAALAVAILLHLAIRRFLKEASVWSLAAILQIAAHVALCSKAVWRGSVAGISVQTVVLDGLACGSRLAAMLLLDIRLPRRGNNWLVQLGDEIGVGTALAMLVLALWARLRTAGGDSDGFSLLAGILLISFGGATALRRVVDIGISSNDLTDVLWMASLCIDAVAMLPQLRLVAKLGGVADKGVSVYLALLYLRAFLCLDYWWWIRWTWFGGTACIGWCMLILYVLHLLLCSHFFHYFIRDCFSHGVFSTVPLVCRER